MDSPKIIESKSMDRPIRTVEFNGGKYAFFRRRFHRKFCWKFLVESARYPNINNWVDCDGRRVPLAVRNFAKNPKTKTVAVDKTADLFAYKI